MKRKVIMSEAKEHPILFSGPMVRAILAGHKTQTRRVVKGMALDWLAPNMFAPEYVASLENDLSPYGYPSDQLWVRESWLDGVSGCPSGLSYRADHIDVAGDGPAHPMKWKSSLFMPRRHSRITLEIVGVRVERLQSITDADACAEGFKRYGQTMGPRYEFADIWDGLNIKRGYSWASNPWVWAIEFKVITPKTGGTGNF